MKDSEFHEAVGAIRQDFKNRMEEVNAARTHPSIIIAHAITYLVNAVLLTAQVIQERPIK